MRWMVLLVYVGPCSNLRNRVRCCCQLDETYDSLCVDILYSFTAWTNLITLIKPIKSLSRIYKYWHETNLILSILKGVEKKYISKLIIKLFIFILEFYFILFISVVVTFKIIIIYDNLFLKTESQKKKKENKEKKPKCKRAYQEVKLYRFTVLFDLNFCTHYYIYYVSYYINSWYNSCFLILVFYYFRKNLYSK